MTDTIAIQACNLSYRYPNSDYLSLDQVSLAIRQGSCSGLIGPNGAGKSTLISALTGLLTPQSGEIRYCCSEQAELAATVRQQVALVPQDFAFYPKLSVQENLNYFAGMTRLNRQQRALQVARVGQECQLAELLKRPAQTLSGGNKRKLNLAIALLKDPQILFLDEPTVGVDPISRQAIIDLIHRLNQSGKTVIYTSHLLNEVESICDDVFVMQEGKISQFNKEQCKRLQLKATQLPETLLEQLRKLGKLVELDERQLCFEADEPAMLGQVLLALSQAEIEIESLSYQSHSLAQFYHETFK